MPTPAEALAQRRREERLRNAALKLEEAAELVRQVLSPGILDLSEETCQLCNHTWKVHLDEYRANTELGGALNKLLKFAAQLREEQVDEEGKITNDGRDRESR